MSLHSQTLIVLPCCKSSSSELQPLPYASITAPQCKGSDVFTREALPEFVVFTYPEHSLVVTQQQQFVDRLVKGFPMTKRVVIITTSALIMTDALNSRILRRRKILDEQDEE